VATTQEKVMEGSNLVDLLITCARAVEAEDSIKTSAIFSRLDSLIIHGISFRSYDHAVVVSSFDHLACYFIWGLHSRMINASSTECHTMTTAPAPAENQMSPTYWPMLQEMSPFIKFAHYLKFKFDTSEFTLEIK
jgi:hypothetical protein